MFYLLNSLDLALISHANVKDLFVKKSRLKLITSTLFIIILHTQEDGGVLDIPIRITFFSMQDSIEQIPNKITRIVS